MIYRKTPVSRGHFDPVRKCNFFYKINQNVPPKKSDPKCRLTVENNIVRAISFIPLRPYYYIVLTLGRIIGKTRRFDNKKKKIQTMYRRFTRFWLTVLAF